MSLRDEPESVGPVKCKVNIILVGITNAHPSPLEVLLRVMVYKENDVSSEPMQKKYKKSFLFISVEINKK